MAQARLGCTTAARLPPHSHREEAPGVRRMPVETQMGGPFMRDVLLGVCHPRNRLDLISAMGLGWVRSDVPFPWAGHGGDICPTYVAFRQNALRWRAAGLQVMGITPYPRGWNLTDTGEPGSAAFAATYRRACAFLARDLDGIVGAWQVANEMNLDMFRQPLSEDQAVAFLRAGATGLKEGQPDALVGVNMAGFGPGALRMYEALYGGNAVLLDYVGSDGYFGSWDGGGPDNWSAEIDQLSELTARPVIIQEFGYASRGALQTSKERSAGVNAHTVKRWAHAWAPAGQSPEHTAEVQAAYARRCLEIFAGDPRVKGIFWYCWSDHERCWNCKAADCPCETAWGLVTVDEEPKPAYHAYREAITTLFSR